MTDDIDALRKALVEAVVRQRLLNNITNGDSTSPIDAYLRALVTQDLRACPSASDLRAQQRRAESAEADWQDAMARLEELEGCQPTQPEAPTETEEEHV